MINQTLDNQAKTNNVNIQAVSHVTMVTKDQSLLTSALLRLAILGCGWLSCIIIVQI